MLSKASGREGEDGPILVFVSFPFHSSLTNSNNGDRDTLVATSDSQETTVGGKTEEVGRNRFGRSVLAIDSIQRSRKDSCSSRIADGQDPVSQLAALHTYMASNRVSKDGECRVNEYEDNRYKNHKKKTLTMCDLRHP